MNRRSERFGRFCNSENKVLTESINKEQHGHLL